MHRLHGKGPTALALAVACGALHAQAAAQIGSAAVSGAWVERDLHYRFEIRPGAKPDQLVVTLPRDVQFPGDHTFVLARTGPAAFASKDQAERPKIAVSFSSPHRGELRLAGSGRAHAPPGGAWIAMEDFTLVRP